jgi:hypothetical protein
LAAQHAISTTQPDSIPFTLQKGDARIMKWLLTIWRLRRVPTLRELPGLYLRAIVFGLLVGPLFEAVGLLLTRASLDRFSLNTMLTGSFVGWVFSCTFFTACGIGNAIVRRFTQGQPRAIVGTAFIGYNALAAPMAFVVAAEIISRVFGNPIPWFWQTVIIESIVGVVIASLIGAFVKLKHQVEEAQAQLRQNEMATARAQSMALQAQINPHFFFNTLNSISALIDSDPKAAQRMIGLLAGMFRYTFGASGLPSVPLEEELGFVRDYLSIEQARFSNRLQVEMPAAAPAGVRVPGLVLQPLVENAVRHGISQLLDGGKVGVYMGDEGKALRIAVRNTADPGAMPDPKSVFKPGHALENVRDRLRLFTGQADPIRMATGPDWVEFSFVCER